MPNAWYRLASRFAVCMACGGAFSELVGPANDLTHFQAAAGNSRRFRRRCVPPRYRDMLRCLVPRRRHGADYRQNEVTVFGPSMQSLARSKHLSTALTRTGLGDVWVTDVAGEVLHKLFA